MKGLDPDTGKTKDEWLRDELIKLQAEVAKMKAELQGTVTTEYHDQIVAEAMKLIAQTRAERDFLWKAWFGRYRRPPWDTGSEAATEPEK